MRPHEDKTQGANANGNPAHLFVSSACRIGYYKPAQEEEEEEAGGCLPCPENTRTHEEGSLVCSCVQGFSRLPTDPPDLGCTSEEAAARPFGSPCWRTPFSPFLSHQSRPPPPSI